MKKIILDDKYEIGSGIGCWAESRETVTVTKGDVRFIGGILMKAYLITETSFFARDGRDIVWWTPCDEKFNDYNNLRKWTKNL